MRNSVHKNVLLKKILGRTDFLRIFFRCTGPLENCARPTSLHLGSKTVLNKHFVGPHDFLLFGPAGPTYFKKSENPVQVNSNLT